MVRKIALLFLILTASICCNARTVYNPQNEKLQTPKTKRSFPQNETYPEKSFFAPVK